MSPIQLSHFVQLLYHLLYMLVEKAKSVTQIPSNFLLSHVFREFSSFVIMIVAAVMLQGVILGPPTASSQGENLSQVSYSVAIPVQLCTHFNHNSPQINTKAKLLILSSYRNRISYHTMWLKWVPYHLSDMICEPASNMDMLAQRWKMNSLK